MSLSLPENHPALRFCNNNAGCSSFKIDVPAWGSNKWLSMQSAFLELAKFNISTSDVLDLSDFIINPNGCWPKHALIGT